MDPIYTSIYKNHNYIDATEAFGIKLTWAVVFQQDGLDIRGMIDYFNEHKNVTVIEVFEVDAHDPEIGITYWYILCTPGITVPIDIKYDLNLRQTDPGEYIFIPVEKDS